jgi:hypothetical protein
MFREKGKEWWIEFIHQNLKESYTWILSMAPRSNNWVMHLPLTVAISGLSTSLASDSTASGIYKSTRQRTEIRGIENM